MSAIDDFIRECPYAHQLFHKVRNHIFETKLRNNEPFESYSLRLTEGERFVILVNGFIWEVTNGGLDQFLTNSTGNYFEQVRTSLHAIGATTAASALDEIRAAVFNNQPAPTNRSRRYDLQRAWAEKDEDAARAFFTALDRKLGWCESVEDAIAKYIITRKEMFPD